ncbi:MAG: D-alanyl-D-alanine carboxypeptidase/D-alanyl-D-alanine-endopeptidase [Candidatus Nanopelagicales bacterium]
MTHTRKTAILLSFLLLWSASLTANSAQAASGPAPVLSPIPVQGSTAPAPTPEGLRASLGATITRSALGTSGIWIGDATSGTTLLDAGARSALLPASTLKLLTAATALRHLGPTARIATRVVVDGGTLTIIGGGDASLASTGVGSSLAVLAKRVAASVRASHVDLVYDTSLFHGRTLGAGWSRSFPAAGVAAPVEALMVDQGRARPKGNTRVPQPARYAAGIFARALKKLGIAVGSITEGRASAQATEVARVESAPVQQLVHHMLTDSDNDLAEALAHLSGVAVNGQGTFAGGAKAMVATAKALNLPTDGIALFDGSGLSSKDRVAPQTLGGILLLSAQGSFGGIAPSLAIAGFTGTLADRFKSSAQREAAGYVRAKTGTLDTVVNLAGIVPDVDGRVLVFAIMANDVPSIMKARAAIDQIAARLRGCGCRTASPTP